jgi:indolepyruvate ferredoxin oxidoreductase beta subunit
MVMLGAATPFLRIDYIGIEDGIRSIFGRKSDEIVQLNQKALQAGFDVANKKTFSVLF